MGENIWSSQKLELQEKERNQIGRLLKNALICLKNSQRKHFESNYAIIGSWNGSESLGINLVCLVLCSSDGIQQSKKSVVKLVSQFSCKSDSINGGILTLIQAVFFLQSSCFNHCIRLALFVQKTTLHIQTWRVLFNLQVKHQFRFNFGLFNSDKLLLCPIMIIFYFIVRNSIKLE